MFNTRNRISQRDVAWKELLVLRDKYEHTLAELATVRVELDVADAACQILQHVADGQNERIAMLETEREERLRRDALTLALQYSGADSADKFYAFLNGSPMTSAASTTGDTK